MNMIKYTKESLEQGVKNTKLPIPFYDSIDEAIRKQIGEVIELHVTDDDMFGFTANMTDGKIVKGKTT